MAEAFGGEVDVTAKIGVWLGLIAADGVAYGGWRAMQEEGTSFGGRSLPGQTTGSDPPPPPPAATAGAAKHRDPGASRPGEERLTATAAFGRPFRVLVQACPRARCATREAIAMMVIIGLTPIELGSRLPSAT